jgi:hypothetical protein
VGYGCHGCQQSEAAVCAYACMRRHAPFICHARCESNVLASLPFGPTHPARAVGKQVRSRNGAQGCPEASAGGQRGQTCNLASTSFSRHLLGCLCHSLRCTLCAVDSCLSVLVRAGGAAEFTRCASSASHHGIVPCQGGRGASASPCISIHLSLYIALSLSISLDLSTIMHFPDPRCSEAAPHDSAPPPPPPAPAESG